MATSESLLTSSRKRHDSTATIVTHTAPDGESRQRVGLRPRHAPLASVHVLISPDLIQHRMLANGFGQIIYRILCRALRL